MKHQGTCDYIQPKKGYFSVGLELEFFIKNDQYITRYFKDAINSYGQTYNSEDNIFDLEDILDHQCGDNLFDSILGFDGAGTETLEFRTPVFVSSVFEKSLDGLLTFSEEVQSDLIKDYRARFRPIYNGNPYGLHFSVGGEFLTGDYYKTIIRNCKTLQPKLADFIPDSVIGDYINREDHYPGDLSDISVDTDIYNISHCTNGIRVHPYASKPERLELRFFPSCFIYSLEECLRFILFDANFPAKKIKFSRC